MEPLPTTDNILGKEEEKTAAMVAAVPQAAPVEEAPVREPTSMEEPDPVEEMVNVEANKPIEPEVIKPLTASEALLEFGDVGEVEPEEGGFNKAMSAEDALAQWRVVEEQARRERAEWAANLDIDVDLKLNEESEEETWLGEIADFGFYGVQGLKAAGDQTFDTFEDLINMTFDTEVDLWDIDYETPDEDDWSDTAGFLLGKEVAPMLAGVGAATKGLKIVRSAPLIGKYLTTAGMATGKAKWIAPLVAFEAGYGTAAQFTQDPDDVLLSDMFNSAEEMAQFNADGFTGPESTRRLMMAGNNAALGLGFGVVAHGVGRLWAKHFSKNTIREVSEVMSGGSDHALNQQQRLEAWFVKEKGLTPVEATTRVKTLLDGGSTPEKILNSIDPTLDYRVWDNAMKGDEEVRKIILGRNLLEAQTSVTPEGSARVVEEWAAQGPDVLARKLEELAGRPADTFLMDAERVAMKTIDEDVEGSVIMGRTEETIRVGLENAALLDGNIQKVLTGIGYSGKEIETAFRKGAGGKFFKDISQSPFILASTITQRVSAHLSDAVLPSNIVKKHRPSLPTGDGTVKYSGAKSLGDIQKDNGFNDKSFTGFLQYVRALKMKNDIPHGIQSPIDEGTLDNIIADGTLNDKYQQALPEFSGLMKHLLDYSKESGVIDSVQYAAMARRATNPDGQFVYIPRHVIQDGIEDIVAVTTKKRSPFRRLEGTDKDLIDPYTDVVQQISSTIYRGQENILKKARYNMIRTAAEDARLPGIAKIASQIMEEVDLDGVMQLPKYKKFLSKDMSLNEKRSIVARRWQEEHKDIIFDEFVDEGLTQLVKIKDPALQRLIASSGPKSVGTDVVANISKDIMEWLAKPTRLFTGAITKTPAFAIKSFIRDSVFVEFASPIGILPKFRTFQGLFNMVTNRQVVEEMTAAGFKGATQITEVGKKMVDRDRLVASAAHGSEIAKSQRRSFLGKLVNGTVETWTKAVNNAEMASRVGEYVIAKKAGMSPELSSFFAVDSAVNFAKSGTSSTWRTFTDIQAFFRPTYLGMSKTGEVMVNNPVKAGLYLTSLAGMVSAMNEVSSLYPDWENITEEDRRLWMYLPNVDAGAFAEWATGGMEGPPPPADEEAPWITIPAVHELQVFANSISRLGNIMGRHAVNDDIGRVLRDSLAGLKPPMSAYGVTPTLLSPVVELRANESKFGNPILRDSQIVDHFKEDIINPTTGDAAIWLSNFSKSIDGIFGDGEAMATPISIDYAMRGLLVGHMELIRNGLNEFARPADKGEQMATPFGDKSKSANPFKYYIEESAAVLFDSGVSHRGYKEFIYRLQDEVASMKSARRNNSKEFIRRMGNIKVRDVTGKEVLLTGLSGSTRNVLNVVRNLDTRIHMVGNDTRLTAEEKLVKVRAFKEGQNALINRYMTEIEKADPDKFLDTWHSVAPTTKKVLDN